MADEWKQDISEDFINIAGIPRNIVDHMLNAVHVSYYKYGSILTKSEQKLREYRALTLKKYEETGNAEKLVDAMNYDMFLYMFTKSPEYIESTQTLISLYDEKNYKGTDSGDSVVVLKKSVSEWLRESILNGI